MKKIFFIITLLAFSAMFSFGQETETKKEIRKVPSVEVKTLDGATFNTANLSNDGKPMIISFWATWCKPCIKELNTMSELYEEWQKETGVKIIAISIDDARRMSSVAPLVNSNGWDFTVLLDPNSDFKRAMGVNIPPQTFVVDGKGNIVWTHTGFTEGGELELIEIIRKINKNEPITQ
ncbi:MAG: TlpA disulfide reductase family protein [Bacteroidota bacterium]